jgi:tetratricopeptide (TPR) repeat protein
MLLKDRIVPNLSKVLVAGLVLGILPWVLSGYLFPRAGRHVSSRQTAHASTNTADSSKTAKPAPLLLPLGETVHRLQPPSEQKSLVLTSSLPAEQPLPARQITDTHDENSIPELGPALNSPISMESLPTAETISAQPSPEMPYPSTDAPAEPLMTEEMPLAEMPANGLDAVPSPAASSSHGSVQSEAVYLPPAVQTTTMPSPPERTPAEAELLHPVTEPEGSPAARRGVLPGRSEQLESIARQADREIRHGYELAGRGAYYAARSEFIAALRMVAQGLDTDRQTTIHGKSLAAGLTALREAEDFLPHGSMVEANLDIPALVESHVTPVLKDADNAQTTSLSALKSYLTYAQDQFAAAADREIAGSMALRALGKLHDELAQRQNTDIRAAGQKAVVFYQAALLVAPQNYMAANDLGVMFARAGNLQDARAILEHSAAIDRQSTVLHNLATVYQRLGRNDLAAQANQRSLLAQQAEQAGRQTRSVLAANGSVEWVAPDAFAQTSPNLAAPPSLASKPAGPSRPINSVRQAPPAQPVTNTFGSYNPHWSPNYQPPAANTYPPAPQTQPTMTGQTPKSDYQR